MGQHLARDVGVDLVSEGRDESVVGLVRAEVHGQGQCRTGRQGDVLGVPQLAVRLWPSLAVAADLGVRVALAEGLRFAGGSFGQYWKRFDGRLGINVGSYVGHCAVRRFVMGDDASEREATPEEIAAMQGLVRDAMREGALGFSTSQIDVHVGEDGREVPSNHASAHEILELASVLAEFDRGAVEIIPRSFSRGYDEADRPRVARLRASIIENVGVLLRSSQPERAQSMSPEFFAGIDDATLVNLLSNALALPVEEKQGLLEADSIPERYARLASVLSFQRAEIEAGEDPSRGSLH